MSTCCNTPHIVRLQKIKDKRSAIDLQELYAGADEVSESSTLSDSFSTKHQTAALGSCTNSRSNESFPTLPRSEMTSVVNPVYDIPINNNTGTAIDQSSSGYGSSDSAMPENVENSNNASGTPTGLRPELIPAAPAPGMPSLTPSDNTASGNNGIQIDEIFPGAPSFHVPSNPLLPPGYNEILDYDALQYLNGFYRTQIGRYVRVEQQINSNDIEIRYGYLIGVGINYLLLQDATTGNVYTIDSYSIKLFYVYYNVESSI